MSCAWGQACQDASARILWERREGNSVGSYKRRADRAFFTKHTLKGLEQWRDHDLEKQGRSTHPMRWDPATDRYVPVSWQAAFDEIGRELRSLKPREVDFYTSGRASLETSYMYQLFARIYGSNNLPDSSNMCHESSSVALPERIGASVGTAILSDFENTDCILSARTLRPLLRASYTTCKMRLIGALISSLSTCFGSGGLNASSIRNRRLKIVSMGVE